MYKSTKQVTNDSNIVAQENRAYQEMLAAAKNRLQGRDAASIADKAGVRFSDAVFLVGSLGSEYEIGHPSFEGVREIDPWLHLIALHYLDLADGFPVSFEAMPFGEMKDGVIRGVKFDRTVEAELKKILSGRTPDEIVNGLKSLGADFVESRADLCAVLPFLPNFPMILNIWYADDEFPTSGKLLITKSADHYLTIEDAVMAGEFVLEVISNVLM